MCMFPLYGYEITYSEGRYHYGELLRIAVRYDYIIHDYESMYDSQSVDKNTMFKLLNSYEAYVRRSIAPLCNACAELLTEKGFGISGRDFFERYCMLDFTEYTILVDKYNKMIQKNNRANSRESALSSITGSSSHNYHIGANIDFYYEERNRAALVDGLRRIFITTIHACGDAYNQWCGQEYYTTNFNAPQAEVYCEEFKALSLEERKGDTGKMLVIKMFASDPTYVESHTLALDYFGDEKGELDAITRHFGNPFGMQHEKNKKLYSYLFHDASKDKDVQHVAEVVINNYIGYLGIDDEYAYAAEMMLDVLQALQYLTELLQHGALCRLNGAARQPYDPEISKELANLKERLQRRTPKKQAFARSPALELVTHAEALWESSTRYANGQCYDTPEEAEQAAARLAPIVGRLNAVNYQDAAAVQSLLEEWQQSVASAVLTQKEYDYLCRLTKQAQGLFQRINAFLAQTAAVIYTYRYERIWYLCQGLLLEKECALLNLTHEGLQAWVQQAELAARSFHYGTYNTVKEADEAYYPDIKHGMTYMESLQRQNQQTGFLGKIKNAVLDLNAKRYEETYNRLTNFGQYGLFPVVDNEAELTQSYWTENEAAMSALLTAFQAEFDPLAMQQTEELRKLATGIAGLNTHQNHKKLYKETSAMLLSYRVSKASHGDSIQPDTASWF